MTRRQDRRCPRHPYGCDPGEHHNHTPPRNRQIRLPATTRVLGVRGSFNRYVAVYDRLGRGNPARRRRLVDRPEVTS